MLILALDTAWRTASAALCQNGKILAYRERDSEMNHSKTILPTAEELLAQQGISLDQTDLFAATALRRRILFGIRRLGGSGT